MTEESEDEENDHKLPWTLNGAKLGTLILNLLSAAHSVSHSKEIAIDLHPPLFMTTLPIDKVDVLKILGIYFD